MTERLDRIFKSIYFHFLVWSRVRVSKRFQIWPEFYNYRHTFCAAQNIVPDNIYSVKYSDEKRRELCSWEHGIQLSFKELLDNEKFCAEILLETKIKGW